MAGLIKEKLLDYALNRLPLDERSDLTIAIQNVLSSLDIRHSLYLRLYLSGYTARDIGRMTNITTDQVEIVLERVMNAIEVESGYTDEVFIHKLELDPRYRKSGIRELKALLITHGKQFTEHALGEE